MLTLGTAPDLRLRSSSFNGFNLFFTLRDFSFFHIFPLNYRCPLCLSACLCFNCCRVLSLVIYSMCAVFCSGMVCFHLAAVDLFDIRRFVAVVLFFG